MKIYHISDLHLGRELNGYSLIEDQKWVLMDIIKKIYDNNIKYLLISGDVFDKYNPSNEAMDLFENFISNLSDNNVNILIISGNHDSKAKLNYLSRFLKKYKINIYTDINTLTFDEDRLSFLMIPYLHEHELKTLYKDNELKELELYQKIIKEHFNITPSNYTHICLCHNFIVGGTSSNSERTLSVGGLEQLPANLFKDFDYTALGHLHIKQKMGEKIYYSGSIMKYSTSEFDNTNVLLSFDTITKEIEEIKLSQARNCRLIKGYFNDILNDAKVDTSRLDYVSIVLDDDGIVYDAFKTLSAYYPYIVSLTHNNIIKVDNLTSDIKKLDTQINPLNMFEEFYNYIIGEQVSSVEKEYITNLLNSLNEEE